MYNSFRQAEVERISEPQDLSSYFDIRISRPTLLASALVTAIVTLF